ASPGGRGSRWRSSSCSRGSPRGPARCAGRRCRRGSSGRDDPLRLLRSYAFTILGIAVGIAGLVALGAMAERIVRFIEGGDRFVLGQISVAGKGIGMGVGFTGGGLLPASKIREIAAVPGVGVVQP